MDTKGKIRLFAKTALRHMREMRLLYASLKIIRRVDGEKLPTDDPRRSWEGLLGHHLLQVVIAEILTDTLGLSANERGRLTTVAALHDYDKRLEKFPEDFTYQERQIIDCMVQKISPDAQLLTATKTDFLVRHLVERQSTFLERLQAYIDDNCEGATIVTTYNRFPALMKRWQQVADSPEWRDKLAPALGKGKGYWDGQKQKTKDLEQEMLLLLRNAGVAVTSPEDVTNWLKEQVEKRYQRR